MFNKLFLPLAIATFFATAAAASKPTATPSGHSSYCYGLEGCHSELGSAGLFDKTTHPFMVAALEMPSSPLADASAGSCYPALSLVTNSIPSATAGSAYSFSLTANGGQPPYTWSFGRSTLPQGFSISSDGGELTGTPSASGTYNFNVVVSDSLKNNVTGSLTLTVAAGSTPPPTQPPPTQPPPTQPPPTQPPPTQPPPTQPPPTQPPPTQPPPTQPPPTQPPPTQPPPTQPPPTQPPPTQPPPTQPPSGPATGTALNACADITKGGTYYLASDVSSTGTCFGIDADGVTLNLNGHTITYGTGGGSTPTPGIENHICSYTSGHYAGGYCGNGGGGLEVYGGSIVQSSNAAPFSDVFSFGQGNYSSAPYIHDVTATFQNQGAQFYYSTYVTPGAKIENNTIYDNVTNIQEAGQGMLSARSAFQGQAIMIMNNGNEAGVGDIISGNKIIGSPQGGVRSNDQNTVIENNDISMNATYSNDFCADIPSDGQIIRGNNCHPKSGRGFHINSGNDTVSNNTINVTELKQNAEYGGCEHGGTYGVQLENDAFQGSSPTTATISGNTITATAGDCDAIGIRITSLKPTGSGAFTNNTVTTSNSGGPGNDYAISADSTSNDGVSFTSNTFQSQFAYVQLDWDGSNGTLIGHNTWQGTPQYTVNAADGGCEAGTSDTGAVCPVNIQFTDTLPNTVKCYMGSVAVVTIGSQVTACTQAK